VRRGVTVLLWILVSVTFLFLSWHFSAWEASLGAFLRAHLLLDGILFTLVALLLLWRLPPRQARRLHLSDKERADVENEARKTLAQILGGVAVLVGIYISFENLRITQENTARSVEQTAYSLELARKGQYTQRLSEATTQLGNKDLAIRLGGIYALEQVAKDDEFHWPVMEILTAYVRENAQWKGGQPREGHRQRSQPHVDQAENKQPFPTLATDIQAILTALGRRKRDGEQEEQRLDLTETDLRGADLRVAHLEKVKLQDAHLEHANLWKALLGHATLRRIHFEGADLSLAQLTRADLNEAGLEGVKFDAAQLEGTSLAYAHLRGARLLGANLQKAYLVRAQLGSAMLQYANLGKAFLRDACLAGADFKNADLKGANLAGTDLRGAINLTLAQLSTVKTLYQAQLDEPLLVQVQQQGYPHLLEKAESYDTELLGLAFEGLDPSLQKPACVPTQVFPRKNTGNSGEREPQK
jgi:uncharacterized protein YjbI with pentapeptide repeats